MIRTFFAAAAIAAAAVSFAPSAGADTPCGSDPVSSIDYALQAVTPDGLELPASYPLSPGSACSTSSECGSSENCEGGSCCVKSGSSCTGLGYCCGHPSQGCVNGTCP